MLNYTNSKSCTTAKQKSSSKECCFFEKELAGFYKEGEKFTT